MNWVSIPASLMAAVSCYVGFYYLWMYARRREESVSLAFAATCLSIALYDMFCAGLYNAASPGQGMFWQRGQFATLAVFTMSVSWFIYHFIRSRSRAPFILISIALLVFFILGLAVRGDLTLSAARPFTKTVAIGGLVITYNEVDPGIIYFLQYVSMLLAAGYLFYILVRNYRGDDRPHSKPILVSFVPIFAAAVNDVLVGAGVYPFIYLLEYAYMFILLSMAYVLQNRFIDLHREVEELTLQLEEKVNDRTLELFFSEITRELYEDISGATRTGREKSGAQAGVDAGSPLRTLSQDISIIMNIDRLLARSLEKVVEISGAAGGYLYLTDDTGGLGLSARCGVDDPAPWISETTARVMLSGKYTIVDRNNERNYNGRLRTPGQAGEAWLFIPLHLRDNAIGMCCLLGRGAAVSFGDRNLRLITAFILQASSTIENAYLYQRMIDRNAISRHYSITPNIEEKMKKAIAYIKVNYNEDISREGLAASINMHPDSFGRFFKIYTNRKMSEYVNELRVMDAAEKLRHTDTNIIDIAFAAGFESLPTFNRAFLKVMKVTPTRYREKNR